MKLLVLAFLPLLSTFLSIPAIKAAPPPLTSCCQAVYQNITNIDQERSCFVINNNCNVMAPGWQCSLRLTVYTEAHQTNLVQSCSNTVMPTVDSVQIGDYTCAKFDMSFDPQPLPIGITRLPQLPYDLHCACTSKSRCNTLLNTTSIDQLIEQLTNFETSTPKLHTIRDVEKMSKSATPTTIPWGSVVAEYRVVDNSTVGPAQLPARTAVAVDDASAKPSPSTKAPSATATAESMSTTAAGAATTEPSASNTAQRAATTAPRAVTTAPRAATTAPRAATTTPRAATTTPGASTTSPTAATTLSTFRFTNAPGDVTFEAGRTFIFPSTVTSELVRVTSIIQLERTVTPVNMHSGGSSLGGIIVIIACALIAQWIIID